MDAFIFKIVVFAALFAIGWGFGRHAERKHLHELEQKNNVWLIFSSIIAVSKPRLIQDNWSAAMSSFQMITLNMSLPISKTFWWSFEQL